MKLLQLVITLLISMPIYAKDYNCIGTRSNPIPLKASSVEELKSITIYLYEDKSFEMTDNNNLLFNGRFTDDGDSITFDNHVAFANKVYISKNDDKITCLQTILYKPDIYKYKTDWFCPVVVSL